VGTFMLMGHIKITTQQKYESCKRKLRQGKIKSTALKQIYFNVNDENTITLEHFNLRSNAITTSEQLPEDSQIRLKHVAV
jgi:hypothetical protein